MELKSLGYIGVNSAKLEDWSTLATKLLGMQAVDLASRTRAFRMDDRKQRLVVDSEEGEGLGFVGWRSLTAARSTLWRRGWNSRYSGRPWPAITCRPASCH